jgi:acyl carrier protein
MLGMSWTHAEVVNEVRSVVAEHAEGEADITEASELVADLGIDSLGVMEVVADLEDRFEMTIDEAELQDVATLGDVVTAIELRLEANDKLKETASA